MKKFLSICLVVTLLMSMIIVNVSAAAPVLDLDVSGFIDGSTNYNWTTATLDETVDTGLRPSNSMVYGWPTKSTFSSINGSAPYLQFVTPEGTTATNGTKNWIKVKDDTLLNMQDMTIEAWMKVDTFALSTYWSKMFAITDGTSANTTMEIMYNANKLYYKVMQNGGTSITKNYDISAYTNKWCHYAFTRSCVAGAWTYTAYINGVKIDALSNTGPATRMTEVGNFYIGGAGAASSGFTGGIADAKVYNSILNANTIKADYTNEVSSYVDLTSLTSSLSLSSTTPVSTNVLKVDAGSIQLQFDNVINVNTLQNGITFKKQNGDPVKGGVVITSTDLLSKKVNVTYGKLETSTSYVLSITDGLKSLNNISATPIEKVFTTSADAYTYIINDDFSGADYIVGNSPPTTKGIVYPATASMIATDQTGAVAVKVAEATANGKTDKYLAVGAPNTKDTFVGYRFSANVTDTVAVEIKAKHRGGTDNKTIRELAGFITPTGANVKAASMGLGTMRAATTPTGTDLPNTSRDEFGFYNIKVLEKKNASGNYYHELYDLVNTSTPMLTITNTSNCNGFVKQYFGHTYGNSSPTQASDFLDISEVKLYLQTAPTILSATSYANKTIGITFSDDMQSISSSNISVKRNSDAAVISCTPVYNSDTRQLTLTFPSFLKLGDYTVSFTNVKSLDGMDYKTDYVFTATGNGIAAMDTIRFYNQSDVEIVQLNNQTTVTGANAKFNIARLTSNTEKCNVVLAVYNGGMLENCVVQEYTLSDDSSTPVSISLEGLNISSTSVVKLFMWSDIAAMKPYIETMVLPYQQNL